MDAYLFRRGGMKPKSAQAADLPLFRGALAAPKEPEQSLRDRFYEFHIQNPGIYLALELAALAHAARGQRTGVKKLVEQLRWDPRVAGVDATCPFKINNSYTAFYARLLIRNHPLLAAILETRRQDA